MIKIDGGTTNWRGNKIILSVELTTLIHALIEQEVLTPEEIDDVVATAKKTEEELDAEIEALKKEVTPGQAAFARMMSEFLADAEFGKLFS